MNTSFIANCVLKKTKKSLPRIMDKGFTYKLKINGIFNEIFKKL